uniref:Secreted protein n=1 Tax=Romanomermis culicivorax TaxID=13658 RepID=A0A915IL09_ROMCU
MLWITVPAGGVAPSMGAVAITNVGCEPELLIVAVTVDSAARVRVTVAVGSSAKAMVSKEAVIMAVSVFEVVICSISIGGASSNRALNSC